MAQFNYLKGSENESYALSGSFVLENFKLENSTEICLKEEEGGKSIKLVRNAYGNKGNLTFDVHIDEENVILLPLASKHLEQNLSMFVKKFKIDDFEFVFDEKGDLKISNPNKYHIDLAILADDTPFAPSSDINEISQVDKFAQIEKGGNGIIRGKINNGRKFVLTSLRETLGNFYSKYPLRNEDSAGVNVQTGRVVIADGIGGNGNGELASHFVTEEILIDWNNQKDAISDAREKLQGYTRFFDTMVSPDVVAVVADIKGNLVELFNIGDTRWILIRDNQIMKTSKDDSMLGKANKRGRLTEEELYSSPYRSFIETSFLSTFNPQIETIELEADDVLLLFSDGIDTLTDDELLACSKETSVDNIQQKILGLVEQKNRKDKYERKLKNGKSILVRPPYDNLSLFVYKH